MQWTFADYSILLYIYITNSHLVIIESVLDLLSIHIYRVIIVFRIHYESSPLSPSWWNVRSIVFIQILSEVSWNKMSILIIKITLIYVTAYRVIQPYGINSSSQLLCIFIENQETRQFAKKNFHPSSDSCTPKF